VTSFAIHPADAPIPEAAQNAAIALGNFDGVHLGHQAVLAAARVAAATRGAALAAAVFEPHPRQVLRPATPPFRIQNDAQRARALAAQGVRHLFEIRFDASLANLTDLEFAERLLKQRLHAAHVTVGFDFKYGHGRTGDVATLRAQGAALGFGVSVVDAVDEIGAAEKISSSAIRSAIVDGRMDDSARMLGRPWAIEGVVEKGFQRGRGIGFPTANVALGGYLQPKLGVYAVRVDLGDGVLRPGVASVGVNPTVGALPAPILESYIFDFDGDLYGKTIETQLIAYLRPQAKSDIMDAMTAQIKRDADEARALLASPLARA